MRTPEHILEEALADFKSTLCEHQVLEYQLEKFVDTTARDVKSDILQIQHAREQDKSLMNLSRLESFVTAFEQFNEVCEAMELGNPELSCFIWGPPRFILQKAKEWPTALDSVLDSYLKFGRRVPLLGPYKSRLRDHDAMRKCLAYMYEDLLRFHAHILKLFAEKIWKRTFSIYWKDYQEYFSKLLEGFDVHARHLSSLAQHEHQQDVQENSSEQTRHFLEYGEDRQLFRRFLYKYEDDRAKLLEQAAKHEEERKHDQYIKVLRWLSNPGDDEQTYQTRWRNERKQYDGTASWILDDSQVKQWMDTDEPPYSILWVYGKKGAGKTILASRIIDHLIEKKTESTTSFFYCREDDINGSHNCMSLYKSLLRQLVNHRRNDLLPLYYDRKLKGQEILNAEEIAQPLLELCFETDSTHFIVIDGLDELSAQARSNAIKFISSVVDKSDKRSPAGKIRVLIVSHDLQEMRKSVLARDMLEIKPSHVEPDIRILVTKQTAALAAKFKIKEEEADRIREMTVTGAKGMMLFAVLVMQNFMAMRNVRFLLKELEEPIFPVNLHQAYGRILERLKGDYHEHGSTWDLAKTIFGWLACAKRPLKWHELQAAFALEVDDRGEPFFCYRLGKSPNDIRELCGSLIQVLPGNRIEFIHQTAKRYIVESQALDDRAIECELTVLCMNYLTLKCFRKGLRDQQIQVAIQNAEYAFQDYAVSKWNEHLQSILDGKNSALFGDPVQGEHYRNKISQALRRFKETYKSGLAIPNDEQTRQLLDPSIPRGECQAFQAYGFTDDAYQALVDIWTHVHRHQKLPAKERNKISIKELGDAVEKIRNKLESLSQGSTADSDMRKMLTEQYGKKIFKCDRVRCDWFHEGFEEKEQRDRHLPRHDRPFLCPIEGCTLVPFGFSTNKDKEKHVKNYHSEELALPAQFRQLARETVKDAKFLCDICDRTFTRLVSLEGHKNSCHFGRRPYACTTCGRGFARANDQRRHEKTKHVRRV